MRNKRKLQVEQLDKKLVTFKEANSTTVPPNGWMNAIRTTLNMTMAQLGKKLSLTKGAIQKMEEREAAGQITLNKLKHIGEALDMQFVYGFVPKDGSLSKLVDRKSRDLANKIVYRTNQNMILEEQGIAEQSLKESVEELAYEIKREMRKSLWD